MRLTDEILMLRTGISGLTEWNARGLGQGRSRDGGSIETIGQPLARDAFLSHGTCPCAVVYSAKNKLKLTIRPQRVRLVNNSRKVMKIHEKRMSCRYERVGYFRITWFSRGTTVARRRSRWLQSCFIPGRNAIAARVRDTCAFLQCVS